MARKDEAERLIALDTAIHRLGRNTLGIRLGRHKEGGKWATPLFEVLGEMIHDAEEILELSRDWRAEVVAELEAQRTDTEEDA